MFSLMTTLKGESVQRICQQLYGPTGAGEHEPTTHLDSFRVLEFSDRFDELNGYVFPVWIALQV
jgi:hypothetical protein